MTPLFDVTIISLKKAYELPHAWTAQQYLNLLHLLEFDDNDDLGEEDLAEMTVMALQDMEEPAEAAGKVLEVITGNLINKGRRQQLIHDMQNERAWEQHADITRHAQIFVATELLNRAFPMLYPKPDIIHLTVDITARDGAAGTLLASSPTPAFVTRLLASTMDEHSALQRLFATQLTGNQFPEATAIIWAIESGDLRKDNGHQIRRVDAYIPNHWIGPLKSLKQFEATSHFDRA